jgi:hypothetical protein
MLRRHVLVLAAGFALAIAWIGDAQEFQSRFAETPDGVWAGPEYWANLLQDWRVKRGRMEDLDRHETVSSSRN